MFTRIKRIRSHTGHARYLAQCTDAGSIPRPIGIPSPYAYSPDCLTYRNTRGQRVIICETSHRCYDVFLLPDEITFRDYEEQT